MTLLNWLKLPGEKSLIDLDSVEATLLHAEIIQSKPFLRRLYIDFYGQLKNSLPDIDSKKVVELGSGGGFIKQIIPNAITSDIIDLPNVDIVFSALKMPFDNRSIDAFFMINVLHHITDIRAFFKEALRIIKPAGKIVMIEPANTFWARLIYKNFHHETFDPAAQWNLENKGPLSHGNGAIPWIIFSRDVRIFKSEFPELNIIGIKNHTPLLYLLSGGFTLKQLMPSCSYKLVKAIEKFLSPANNYIGMFQTIELQRIS